VINTGGQERVYKVSSESVRTPGKGEEIGVVLIFHDVTAEKEVAQIRDDFLHAITHDLRNPLGSIQGFAKFLRDGFAGAVSAHQVKILNTIERATVRLLGMVNNILDLAKMEAGKMETHKADVDLRETVRASVDLLQSQATTKNVALEAQIPEAFPLIRADPSLMERLFTNLIGNAIKFTPEEGRVTVEIHEEAERICGSVTDTGEGIPPDYIGKIFDKFLQVAGQRKGGTGLGLTICKHIVESHGGAIGVESEVGKGSRFHFWIVKEPAQESSHAA
jgi:signal transduction histidine kinase